ncbi:MAG: lysophospholipase [Chthoniobacteraceae bacterium]|nr:lysophospholipase [Chthoniobacteraceae bacterium]
MGVPIGVFFYMDYHEHLLASGSPLFLKEPLCQEPIYAEVILTHGRGEHSGRYGHVTKALAAHGLRLWSYDLRGHGRSGGVRGDLPAYSALLDDLDRVIGFVKEKTTAPIFLLGHSLGGQITLNYLQSRKFDGRGAIVASPYLRLAYAPPRWRLILAGAARWIWPSLTQPTPLPWERLSRDQAHMASFPDPELTHHLISARMYHAIRNGALSALAGAANLKVPLLLIHGAEDLVTSVEATREFFSALGSSDKTLRIYPEMLHETHNDIGREQVISDIIGWIKTRAGGNATGIRNSASMNEK